MLSVGGLPAPPFTKTTVSKKPPNSFPLLSLPISKTFFFPLSTLSPLRSGLCLFAQKKHRNGRAVVLDSKAGIKDEDDVDDFDVVDNYFEDDDENYEENEKEDDLNIIVPGEELDEWLKRKPRGFGEGKVYDTSIEDGLLVEIEQIKKVQLDNISKLKILSLEQDKQLKKDAEAGSTGASVRISHLPKKRNIQRDLNTAFKGISGIVNIIPVVFGNKKTKDPICKGLAFVNFKSLEDAKRFIDIISTQSITFGKIDKRIKCEIVDSTNTASHNTLNKPNVGGVSKADSVYKSGLSLLDEEEEGEEEDEEDGEEDEEDEEEDEEDGEEFWDMDSGDEETFKSLIASELDEMDGAVRKKQKLKTSVVSQPSKRAELDSADQTKLKTKTSVISQTSKKHRHNSEAAIKVKSAQKKRENSGLPVLDDEENSRDLESGDEETFKSLISSELAEVEDADRKEQIMKVVSQTSKRGDNPEATAKVKSGQKKKEKNKVANIPKAEQRLKLREKAMLADVYSRYGSKVNSASKEITLATKES